jgi:hypothetical protein
MDLVASLLALIGYTILLIFAIILLYSFIALIISILYILSLPFLWLGCATDITDGRETASLSKILEKGFVYAIALYFGLMSAED